MPCEIRLAPMNNLPQLLAQPTPFGLTVGQIAAVAVVAMILFSGWLIVRIIMRVSALFFRIGCAALIVFICGIVSFIALYNFTAK